MADNVGYTQGSGTTVATDDIGGVQFQRVKLIHGADGVNAGDIATTNPLPVAAYGELIEAIEALRMTVGSLALSIGQVLPDSSGRMRIVLDAITAALTLATVTTVGTVTTVSTVSNQTNMGGYAASELVPSAMFSAAESLRRNITIT